MTESDSTGEIVDEVAGRRASLRARELAAYERAVEGSDALDPELKRVLKEARGALERLTLSEADREDGADQLGRLTEELAKPERDQGRVRRLFDYLKDIAPQITSILSSAVSVVRDEDWRDRLIASLRDCGVQRAPRYRLLWYIASFPILLAITLLSRLGTTVVEEGMNNAPAAIGLVVWLLWSAFCIFVLARVYNRVLRRTWQGMARHAEEELKRAGSRRPILYLRSFQLDARIGRPSWVERYLGFRPLMTAEQHLAKELRKLGPVIAIGRPGEKLPALGAARFYVSDDLWQQKVIDIVRCSQLIVWATGVTEGLRWEISHLIETIAPEKLILWAHPHLLRVEPEEREEEWRRFRVMLGGSFPKPLPEILGEARFVYFTGDWRPCPVAPPRHRLWWALRSLLNPQRSALRAVLQVKQGTLSGSDVAYEAPTGRERTAGDFAHVIGAAGRPVRWARALGFVGAIAASRLPFQLVDRHYSWTAWLLWIVFISVPALAAFRYLRGIATPAAVAAAVTTLLGYLYRVATQDNEFLGLDSFPVVAGLILVPFVRRFLFLAGLAWSTRRIRPLGLALAVGAVGAELAGWIVELLVFAYLGLSFDGSPRFALLSAAELALFVIVFSIAVHFTPPRPGKEKTPLLPDL